MCLGGPGIGIGASGDIGSGISPSGFGGYEGAMASAAGNFAGGTGDPGTITSGAGAGLPASIGLPAFGGSGNAGQPASISGGPLSGDPSIVSGGNPISNFLANYVLPIANLVTSIALPASIPAKAGLGALFAGGKAALQGKGFPDIAQSFARGSMDALPFVGSFLSATEGKGPIPALAGLLGETGGGGYAGQPTGSISGMGGGPGADMTLPNLTTGMGYTPMAAPVAMPQTYQQEQPPKQSLSQPGSVPIEQVTASMYSIPAPKTNYRNIMASRGVRDVGTKSALPEWFQKGKRGY